MNRLPILLLCATLAAGEAATEAERQVEARYRAAVEAALRRYDAELAALGPTAPDAATVAAERARISAALTPATSSAAPALVRLEPATAAYAHASPGATAVWWLETDGHCGTAYLAFPLGAAGATAGQLLLRSADAVDAESDTGLAVLCGQRVVGSIARLGRNQELRVPVSGLPETAPFTLVLVGGGSDGAGLMPGGTLLLVPGGSAPVAAPTPTAPPPTPPATAPVAAVPAATLDEGFDDQASLARWDASTQRLNIADGVLTFTGGNHSGVSSKAKLPVEDLVVEFRGSAETNGFHCHLGPYNVNFGSYGNSECGAGTWPDHFKRVPTGKVYDAGQWRTYRIERRGDRLAGYVDGVLKVEQSITTRTTAPAPFTINAYQSTLKLDWVKMRPADGASATPPAPEGR